MRVFHGILLSVSGCQAPSVPDYRPVDTLHPVVALVDTAVVGRTAGAVSVDGFQIVTNVDGALAVLDPRSSSPRTLRAVGPEVWDATSLADGSTLIASDSGLLIDGAYLQPSPLQALLSAPALQVVRRAGTVWLRTEQGLSLWRGGSLLSLDWDGDALTAPFAPGAVEDGIEVVWSANARGLVAVGETSTGWAPVLSLEGVTTTSLAVDAAGVLVASTDEGLLVRRDGGWAAWSLPDHDLRVLANVGSSGLWVVGNDGVWWTDGTRFEVLSDLPQDATLPDGARSVDGAGRLLLAGEGALYRVAHTPTVAVVGVRNLASIDGETTVSAQTTPVTGLKSVSMVVDKAPLQVTDGAATLDPFAFLDDATHHLEATAAWEDGSVGVGSLDFTVGAVGAATWTDNVEPLFEARCAKCHAGSTVTRLDSAEAWQSNVDQILDDVTSKRMPLGGPALSGGEISVIRAWQEGGFP